MRSKDLITINDPTSLEAESYKMFRSNLNYMNVDEERQVILFTSSLMGEGKTTSISNVAVSFALDGMKTLLVECDLRRAMIHSVFDLPQSPGITNALSDKKPLEDVVTSIDEVPLLDVLTAGPLPPTPAELLGSKAIESLIAEARTKYDRILIDAPPILSVTDTVVLNRLVDGVILVVAAHTTKKETISKSMRMLTKIDASLLGVLISKIDMKRSGYYDYFKYGYVYGEEKPSKNPFKRKKKSKPLDKEISGLK